MTNNAAASETEIKKKPRQIYRVHLSWTLLIFKMLQLITFKEKEKYAHLCVI